MKPKGDTFFGQEAEGKAMRHMHGECDTNIKSVIQ